MNLINNALFAIQRNLGFVLWFVVGGVIAVPKHYMRDNGGFFSFWWFRVWKKSIVDAILTLCWGVAFEVLAFIPIFIIYFGGDKSNSSPSPRRNTDSLGRNYTDPYNQGRIDAANGASPINPGDPNYMAGYNNNKNNNY